MSEHGCVFVGLRYFRLLIQYFTLFVIQCPGKNLLAKDVWLFQQINGTSKTGTSDFNRSTVKYS